MYYKPRSGYVGAEPYLISRQNLVHFVFNRKLFYYIEREINNPVNIIFNRIWFHEATFPNEYDNTVYMNNALKVLQHEV